MELVRVLKNPAIEGLIVFILFVCGSLVLDSGMASDPLLYVIGAVLGVGYALLSVARRRRSAERHV